MPLGIEVEAAIEMTREGSELHVELRGEGRTEACRRDIARVSGFYNHLAAVVPALASCMRSITHCLYAGCLTTTALPSATIDWDGVCQVSVRAWLDLVRALWILERGDYTRILTKRGRFGLLAIQDASEEDGGGFAAEVGGGCGRQKRMVVIHGPHMASERHWGSGAKELAFVRNTMRLAAQLWKSRKQEASDGVETGRQQMLGIIDPGGASAPRVGQLLLFTDSTVSIFAGRKTYSNAPEVQAILDEIELLLMQTGLVVAYKHLPGKAMIRVHVDAASRRDAGALLRVKSAMDVHPFALHRWGLTTRLRTLVLDLYPNARFVEDGEGIEWASLSGTTFCFYAYPESLMPTAMRALDVWTSRPMSTTVIMLVVRDFGTPGLRPILRQFDTISPGKRYRRLEGSEDHCVWDTLLAVKSPRPPPAVSSRQVAARHRELMSVMAGSIEDGGSQTKSQKRRQRRGKEGSTTAGVMSVEPLPATAGGDPIGADVALALGLGSGQRDPGWGGIRERTPSVKYETLPNESLEARASRMRQEREFTAEEVRLVETNEYVLEVLNRYGVYGEHIRRRREAVVPYVGRMMGEGNALRGRRLTGARSAQMRAGSVQCVKCHCHEMVTEAFACVFRNKGAESDRFGTLPACHEVLCSACLSSGVPPKAHPSRSGRAPVVLGRMHARLVAGTHVCAHCRWAITTGKVLHENEAEDRYVWELITQMILDMYRHLTPNTVRGYAREVNLMRDFQRAVPDISIADVMGGVTVDISDMHVTTTHAMLWLHLERSSGIGYGAIRKTRSVHSKLCELYGSHSVLNKKGGEFKRFTKAFRMRVGTGTVWLDWP